MKVPRNIQQFVQVLEKNNQLVRIRQEVCPELIITEINDRVVKRRGPALLFENVKKSKFPILINAFGSFERLAMSMGEKDISDIINKVSSLLEPPKLWDIRGIMTRLCLLKNAFPKKVRQAKCQETIKMDEHINLYEIPVLTCWPKDAGAFITLPQVITKDPLTGKRNVGMYRLQIMNKNTTGMHWQIHKVGAKHYNKYKKAGIKRIAVSVAIGGTPAITYAATAPLPDDMDEIMLAGILAKQRIKMVKCITNDLYVPAEADFILEGYVDVDDLIVEGPFGDHTGYYSLADKYPRFHVKCITHRKKPIYLTTVVGRPPMEDYYLANMTEKLFLPMMQKIYPEVLDMSLPVTGAFHNLCLLKIEPQYPQHAKKIMTGLWGTGQIMFTKCFFIYDYTVELRNHKTLLNLFVQALGDKNKRLIVEGPVDSLDHSSPEPNCGSKIGFDLTGLKVSSHLQKATKEMNFIPDELIKEIFYSNWGGIIFSLVDDIPKPHHFIKQYLKDHHKYPPFVVIIDNELDPSDEFEVFFRLCANIDPARDILFPSKSEPNTTICDATSKTKEDDFHRQWPEDLVFDEKIYQKVDKLMQDIPELDDYKKRVKGCHFIDKDGNYQI